MLGANARTHDGRVVLPAESEDERQQRIAQQQSKRLRSILNEISGHLGHWTAAKQSLDSLAAGGARYEPSMRFAEAVDDLRKMLVPSGNGSGSGEASEEVARLMEASGIVHKHLAPLFTAIPVSRHLHPALHLCNALCYSCPLLCIVELFTVLLDDHPGWEFAEDTLHHRRVLKKLLGHAQILGQLLALFVHCLSSPDFEQQADRRHSVMKRCFDFLRSLLAVPDAPDAFATGNGLSRADLGRTAHVVRAMKETRLLEFLLTAAASVEQSMFRPHAVALVDIFASVFSAYQTARKVAHLQPEHPATKPTRHSNFSGSIVFRLSTGQDYVLRQGSYFNGALDLDRGKKVRGVGGRRAPPMSYQPYGSKTCSAADPLLGWQLADSFLASSFNVLVRHVAAEELPVRLGDDRFHRAFLRLVTWFLQYARQAGDGRALKSVYAALDVDMLLVYARLMKRFHEEAKKNGDLPLTCVVFFGDVLRTVEVLGSLAEDSVAQQAARDIQNALFYQMDLLTRFRLIIQGLKAAPTTQGLTIVVGTVHVLLKLLERYCEGRTGSTYVARSRLKRNGTDDDEEAGEREDLIERRFDFAEYIRQFANESVLDAYIFLLLRAPSNSPALNRHLAVMFYRLAVTARASRLFHKVAFLDAAYRLLRSAPAVQRANLGLVRVCTAIVAGFLRELQEDRLLVVEALFPYTPERAVDNHDEYNDGSATIAHRDDPCERDEDELPDALSREQKMRTLVRRLVDQEQAPHLHWLCSTLSPTREGDGGPVLLVAGSDSQKRALSSPSFAALLRMIGVRGPSAALKNWHLPAGSSVAEAVLHIRSVIQEALSETVSLPARRPATVVSESESEGEGGSPPSEDDVSEFDLNLAAPPATEHGKASRWRDMLRAGFFTASPHDDGDGVDGGKRGRALPLAIEDNDSIENASRAQEGEASRAQEGEAKRPRVCVLDSDDE